MIHDRFGHDQHEALMC
jgi:hypothetical protein